MTDKPRDAAPAKPGAKTDAKPAARAGKRSGAPRPGREAGMARRTAARLAAVQALYQIDFNAARAEAVIAEFLNHRIGKVIDDGLELDADREGGSFTFFRENILMLFRTTSIPLQIGREGGGASTVMHNQSQQANETHCDSQKQHKATQSNTNKIKTSSLTDHLMHSFP